MWDNLAGSEQAFLAAHHIAENDENKGEKAFNARLRQQFQLEVALMAAQYVFWVKVSRTYLSCAGNPKPPHQ